MGKKSKIISFAACFFLVGALMVNMFSRPTGNTAEYEKIYKARLKPINFPRKTFTDSNIDRNDNAIKLARLWEFPAFYNKASEMGLVAWESQHPNNVVKEKKLLQLYGINVGTKYWDELTAAYEKYASDSCWSYSGYEIEGIYAEAIQQQMTPKEVEQLYGFFNSDFGKKALASMKLANHKVMGELFSKQMEAVKKESGLYSDKIDGILVKYHKENPTTFERIKNFLSRKDE